MQQQFRTWLHRTGVTDPVERQQAPIFQIILLSLSAMALVAIPLNPISGAPVLLITVLVLVVALILVRTAHFNGAVLLAALGIIAGVMLGMIPLGLNGQGSSTSIASLMLPITLTGLLARRKNIWLIAVVSIVSLFVFAAFNVYTPTLVGYDNIPYTPFMIAIDVTFVLVLLTLMFDRFSESLRSALTLAVVREQELNQIHMQQEQLIAERTAELRTALAAAEQREVYLNEIITENETQRATIRAMSLPIIPMTATTMVIPLIGVLDSERLQELQARALQTIQQSKIRNLVLDITGIVIVDRNVAQGLVHVAASAQLMGTKVSIVGIRPEVAQTMVGLGMQLPFDTHANLQSVLRSFA